MIVQCHFTVGGWQARLLGIDRVSISERKNWKSAFSMEMTNVWWKVWIFAWFFGRNGYCKFWWSLCNCFHRRWWIKNGFRGETVGCGGKMRVGYKLSDRMVKVHNIGGFYGIGWPFWANHQQAKVFIKGGNYSKATMQIWMCERPCILGKFNKPSPY